MALGERIVISYGLADNAQIAEFERDRRDVLRRGIGLSGAVVVAASTIPLLLAVRDAFAQTSGDSEILAKAIGLEQVAVLAYGAAIDSGRLGAQLARVAARFRDHEQQHADALTTALTDRGGTPPQPATAKDIEGFVKSLGAAASPIETANLLIELETAAVAAYLDAQRKLIDGKLLQTGASIMANEAQHLVVLRGLAKLDPVPNAFETGKK